MPAEGISLPIASRCVARPLHGSWPNIPDVLIEQVEVADEITLALRTASPTACCPSCGTISSRVQSRYSRTLHDLPASGRAVTLFQDGK
ncbi:MAG: hypothetical protein E6I91_10810 [Chloroflexi bacterium]|nr:MAG: hypothetical protein E6I91_10810 [Chloroflexota bacterium]